MRHALILPISLAVVTPACDDSPVCVEASRTELSEPDDVVLEVSTFEEVLTSVVGERSGPLRWQPSEPYLRGFPSPGDARISVTIYQPKSAESVEVERTDSDRLPGRRERVLCSGWLETELEVELKTSDGALDAFVRVPAVFREPGRLTTELDVTEVDLGGLSFDPVDPDASLRLRLDYGFTHDPNGSLIEIQRFLQPF